MAKHGKKKLKNHMTLARTYCRLYFTESYHRVVLDKHTWIRQLEANVGFTADADCNMVTAWSVIVKS